MAPETEHAVDAGSPNPIEQQLSREADRLLASLGPAAPTAALLAEHRRRARARRFPGAVSSIVAVLIVVGAAVLIRNLRPGELNVARSVVPHKSGHDTPSIDAPRAPDPPGDRPPPTSVTWEPDAGLPTGIPVLFTIPEGDEQKVIATGIYVPERVEPLDFLHLTPAEQHAVRQVLGIPEEPPLREPI